MMTVFKMVMPVETTEYTDYTVSIQTDSACSKFLIEIHRHFNWFTINSWNPRRITHRLSIGKRSLVGVEWPRDKEWWRWRHPKRSGSIEMPWAGTVSVKLNQQNVLHSQDDLG